MTIQEVLSYIAEIKPHTIGDDILVRWLSKLDGLIYDDMLRWHEDAPEKREAYDAAADMDTELYLQHPYDDVYPLYLIAQIDYANGEYGRFNNSMIMFNSAYSEAANAYNREHMPIQPKKVQVY